MRTIRPSSPSFILMLVVLGLSMSLVACAGSGATTGGAPAPDIPVEQPGVDGVAGEGLSPDGQPGRSGGDTGAPLDDARIIRTGTISLEVREVPAALQTARDAIRSMGGYIGASQTYGEGDRPVAVITYRVPADRWEDALDLLRDLDGQTTKVVEEQTQAVEVTGAVADLEARIRNLRASEEALQAIAAKAVRISDVLEVQAQLTQVRGEIEALSAQLKDLEDRADYATLTASYRLPVVAVEIAREDWDPTSIVDEAAASLINVVQTLAGVGIWFVIVGLPIVLMAGALVLVAMWTFRRLGIARPSRRPSGEEASAS
jgi:hypothetical protein